MPPTSSAASSRPSRVRPRVKNAKNVEDLTWTRSRPAGRAPSGKAGLGARPAGAHVRRAAVRVVGRAGHLRTWPALFDALFTALLRRARQRLGPAHRFARSAIACRRLAGEAAVRRCGARRSARAGDAGRSPRRACPSRRPANLQAPPAVSSRGARFSLRARAGQALADRRRGRGWRRRDDGGRPARGGLDGRHATGDARPRRHRRLHLRAGFRAMRRPAPSDDGLVRRQGAVAGLRSTRSRWQRQSSRARAATDDHRRGHAGTPTASARLQVRCARAAA